MDTVVVGSRDSQLALLQTEYIIARLKNASPETKFFIKKIKTKGDKILDVALSKIGDKGLFVKELESSLLSGEIDFAVHSMKDVPTALPEGLEIAVITEREDPRDVLITGDTSKNLGDMPAGTKIGTSSLRRKSQLLNFRSDFEMVEVRGNLNTRFKKLLENQMDALILAYAGVKRLGKLDKIAGIIPLNICLPAVGQGALGIETRADDSRIKAIVSLLEDRDTRAAVTAERSLLRRLEGGCQVPIGAYGSIKGEELYLQSIIASLDGKKVLKGDIRGKVSEAEAKGIELAESLLARGGNEILRQVRQEFDCDE